MQTNVPPVPRRIAWLILLIGAVGSVAGIVVAINRLATASTSTPFSGILDAGWLLILGLIWLVCGLLLLSWLRPAAGQAGSGANSPSLMASPPDPRLAEIDASLTELSSQTVPILNSQLTRLSARLIELDKAIKAMQAGEARFATLDQVRDLETRIADMAPGARQASESTISPSGADADDLRQQLDDLDHELDSLVIVIQDAHKRLDTLGDVASRLDKQAAQLDQLYITLEDIHGRIDHLEQQ
ncbi:MAG TPA: hypothetical protein VMT24_12910 [Aggregatilineaceae bacterium]|nr:hypothetical protein [Aggregatilineaceae bacterium]